MTASTSRRAQLPALVPAHRSLAPDLARGVMLALIASANAMIYLHGRPYGLRQHVVTDSLADHWVTGLMIVGVDARAYPLFAALFGYGLVRIAQRSRAGGLDAAAARAVVRRRSVWLMIFGLVHAVAGFSGDILGWYGLLGVIIFCRRPVADRTLLCWAAGWLLVASAVQGLTYSDPSVREQRSYLWSFGVADPLRALGWRLVEWPMTPVGLLAVVSPVLVGTWSARRRVLDDVPAHRRLLVRTALIGITIGIVGGVGMALATVTAWTPPYPVVAVLSWLHILTGVPAGLGYAAIIALAADRLERRWRGRLLAPVTALRATGERSLSCYLFQTAVFVALLPAWTLGFGAALGPAQAVALAGATWLSSVLLAHQLARRGRRGPAEALLHRLTYAAFRPARSRVTIR